MRLVVQRSGGFAGLSRRGELSDQELSSEQRAALARVIESPENNANAKQGEQPEVGRAVGADEFMYRLDIEDDSGKRSITLPESKMPAELKSIVR